MQKFPFFIALLFLINSCHMNDHNPLIDGKVLPSVLQKEPYKSAWFEKHYNEYHLKDFVVSTDSIKINVYFGSWCGDSHRQVPAFIKIAEENSLFYDLYGVNTDMKSTKGFEKDKNIHHVPTFIVLRDGVEIGRIIETPIVSLEADLTSIVSGKAYTPNHAD